MYTQLVQELKLLLSEDSIVKQSKRLNKLSEEFNLLKTKETSAEDVNALLAKDLLDEVYRKLQIEKNELKEKEEVQKTLKQKLIEELELIIQNEQNIGKAFSSLKTIREAWTKASEEGAFKLKDLDQRFTKLIEDFYYNINIYKAIQDHDLKRNQQLKDALLLQIEALSKTSASRQLMSEVKKARSEWEAIGPVKRDLQDEYWTKYKNLLDQIYASFDLYKESEKELHLENLNKKTAIIDFIKGINVAEIQNGKEWKTHTEKVLELQKAWKTIGHVPKAQKDSTWIEYRELCDLFFNAKKSFLEAQKEKYKANKKLKIALCKEADEWKDHDDLYEATDQFVKLQKKWKQIGQVHQRDEQFLWHKFQKSCNAFFNKKKESAKKADQEKDLVNTEKAAIIEKLSQLEVVDEKQLKEIYFDWLQTNRSFTKKSKALEKSFEKSISKSLRNINIDFNLFLDQNFEEKINIYKTFVNGADILDREKLTLKDEANAIRKEITQYENNLGFFGNSKGAQALLSEVQEKIDKSKSTLDLIQKKIKRINLA